MREIIEKLYYGNIKPTEKPIKEESGYQESARLAVRHEEYLLKSLIGEQKATFEKFTDAMSEVDCCTIFIKSFQNILKLHRKIVLLIHNKETDFL